MDIQLNCMRFLLLNSHIIWDIPAKCPARVTERPADPEEGLASPSKYDKAWAEMMHTTILYRLHSNAVLYTANNCRSDVCTFTPQ